MPVRDILIAAPLIAALPFCFFRPFFGVAMWAIISLLNPHMFMWSLSDAFPWAEAVAIPTLLGFIIFARGWARMASRETVLMLAMWCWFTFTTVHNSNMPEFTHFAQDTWLKWQTVSKTLLMTVVTVAVIDSWSRLRTYVLVISGCLGFLVAKAVPFMILTAGTYRVYGPRGSSLADNNDFGLALNMTLPMFFFLARTDPSPRVRKIAWFLFGATIPAIFFTYSRGALLGLAAVMFIMIAKSRQKLILIPALLLAAVFAVCFTPQKWQSRMNFSHEGALIDDSALSRINAWTYCWRLVSDYPLTGAGFEAFTPKLFDHYAPNPRDVHGPHSVYFGVLAEHGFPGLLLYLILVGSTFMTLHKAIRLARECDDAQAEGCAMMLQLGMVGFLVSGAFLGRAYFDYYFTIVGCASVVKRLCSAEAREYDESLAEMTFQEQPA